MRVIDNHVQNSMSLGKGAVSLPKTPFNENYDQREARKDQVASLMESLAGDAFTEAQRQKFRDDFNRYIDDILRHDYPPNGDEGENNHEGENNNA